MRYALLLALCLIGCIGSREAAVHVEQGTAAAAASRPSGPRKLALLIGIGRYYQLAAGAGWRPWPVLHVRQEVEEYRQVLIRDYGFAERDVRIILDEQATAANIRAAFRGHLLEQASPGDIVLFHYSGHGQQIPDEKDPLRRDEQDGLDESLVPYDVLDQSVAEGVSKNIRDDEVDDWLEALTGKMSDAGQMRGHIAVTLDTCFSGSATRAALTPRGRKWDVTTDGPAPSPQPSLPDEGSVRLLPARRALRKNIVVLAASRSDQSAWEKNGRGVFMRHWIQLLAEARASSMPTYAAAIDKLAIDIAAEGIDQAPQVEGAAEHLLFSGLAMPAARPAAGVRVLRDAQGQWWLQAGKIHGVTKESKYRLYKPGAADLNEGALLAEALVVDVTPFRARLEPLSSSRLDGPGALAIESAHSYSMAPIHAVLTGFDSVPEVRKMLTNLDILQTSQERAGSASVDPDPDVELRYVADSNSVAIIRPTESVPVKTFSLGVAGQTQIASWLKAEWRRRQLIRLRHENDATRVDLELLPADAEMDSARNVHSEPKLLPLPQPAAHLRLPRNRFFALRLLNRSSRDLYVTVLGMSADGDIDLLFPKVDGGTNRIVPGGSLVPPLRTHVIKLVGNPGERVVLKVIATDVYVDLSGASTSGALNQVRSLSLMKPAPRTYRPLQWLLASIAAGTRGSGSSLQPAEWGTTDASLTIEPE